MEQERLDLSCQRPDYHWAVIERTDLPCRVGTIHVQTCHDYQLGRPDDQLSPIQENIPSCWLTEQSMCILSKPSSHRFLGFRLLVYKG